MKPFVKCYKCGNMVHEGAQIAHEMIPGNCTPTDHERYERIVSDTFLGIVRRSFHVTVTDCETGKETEHEFFTEDALRAFVEGVDTQNVSWKVSE